jgi:inhibitor of cysteine peptidase
MYKLVRHAASAALAGAALLCAACSPLTLTERDNGRLVRVSPGSRIQVQLDCTPSTGYIWELGFADPAMIRQGEISQIQPAPHNPPIVGAPVTSVMNFQAVGRGHSALKLVNHRPWEKDTPPAQTFAVDVSVE